MIEPCWLEEADVRVIQGEIIAKSGGAPGLLSEGSLEATLSKPKQLYCYGEAVTLFDLAAAYGYGLVKNHYFVECQLSVRKPTRTPSWTYTKSG